MVITTPSIGPRSGLVVGDSGEEDWDYVVGAVSLLEHPDLVIDIRATSGGGRTDYDELPGSLQMPLDGTRVLRPREIVLIAEDFEIALGNV